jgi:hypothetical protein
MPAQQQDKKLAEQEKQDHRQLNAVIGHHVLHTLGQPANLHRMQVRQLWDDHYRVNIFVGEDATSATVAHSYFLVVDSAGAILRSTPNILRQY